MAYYRKRPLVVEALKMTREIQERPQQWPMWLWEASDMTAPGSWHRLGAVVVIKDNNETSRLCVNTGGCLSLVGWGDYLVHTDGVVLKFDRETFEATYEPVGDDG